MKAKFSHHSGSGWAAFSCRVFIAALCFTLAGCGYSTKTLYPEQYRTVAVPNFDNRSFYQGVHADLAEALVKQVEQHTPYKVVSSTTADTIIEGVIVDIQQNQLSRRRAGAGVPQEIEVTITVNWQWKDLRTGKVIRDRAGFRAMGRHLPGDPVGEPVDVALHAAVDQLATDIVTTLQADW